ncbi:hypothetical protein [Paraburkholderia haematera]|uniref:Uncharacterized protein n=1 Tax=Paraburkholderia haematera TaxID=2793077 RepID=A0ABM8S0A1_9BURK|nr:hypothetical protein [Paraburkholderia haematera]CAE6781561.1 hypothetical protein R69888_04326 [Paraburkholderia haematera]
MTGQSVREASGGKPEARQDGAAATPPADPSAPLVGKRQAGQHAHRPIGSS